MSTDNYRRSMEVIGHLTTTLERLTEVRQKQQRMGVGACYSLDSTLQTLATKLNESALLLDTKAASPSQVEF